METVQQEVDVFVQTMGVSEEEARDILGINKRQIANAVEVLIAKEYKEAGLPVDYFLLWLEAERDLLKATVEAWTQ